MIVEAELPGVRFRAEPPAAERALPRMDVVAFVGFAAAGPVGVPVAVEDAARFRDLFGSDPPLAWDAEAGRLRTAHLGAAVEDFFRNGGRRCWVVRVAGAGAVVQRFPVPGLVRADSWEPAEARARAEGSWADRLRAGAVLDREGLPLDPGQGEPFAAAAGDYRVHLSLPPGGAAPGDLLEIDFGEAGPVLFLAVEAVEQPDPRRRGLLLTARRGFWSIGQAPLAEADGLTLWDSIRLASPPQAAPSVRRLTFELLAWEGDGLRARLGRLGFAASHPRFWASLPMDSALLTGPLARDASAPRFPFAGPEDTAPLYLPAAMPTVPAAEAARGPSGDASPETALERDGLADFGAHLFLDTRLARLGAGSLLAEANHRFYVMGEDLGGLHALLPLEEVSLISVPDAVHSGWEREAPETATELPAPRLSAAPDAGGGIGLAWTWTGPADATFRVEEGDKPDLGRPVRRWDGIAGLGLVVPAPEACPAPAWFRVRADRGGQAGPWSNTVRAVLLAEPFALCEEEPLEAPEPRLEPYGSPVESDALVWAGVPGATSYTLEESVDPAFGDARPTRLEPGEAHRLSGTPRRTLLYRVRAERDGEAGPWSITLRRPAPPLTTWRTAAFTEDGATVLGEVQRALLRFCCARGDLLALLALPRSFREEQALDHLTLLTPGSAAGVPGRVPLLTLGERPVLSYGALYHPWIARRGAGAEAGGEAVWAPPEGAVAGTCATLARTRGAWIAPANVPLRDVVALDPPFSARSWARLLSVQVNLLRPDPRGFLALSADTLSHDAEVRPVNVRRLLSLLRRLALREGNDYVFEPHDDAFRRRVWRRFDQILAGLYVRGAFTGAAPSEAYRVVIDASVNPPGLVELGRFVVELRVAPSRPMAFITVRLVQAGQEPPFLEEA